ncbi:YufK family protein [Metabacillus sp. GX 13764]|uniref:DUF5366 family protein n=1 Tax=Metabacillus kandeliae TaxID=2900151 RepID=UPI001E4D296F|nr:DUF5366 family protein [Metabacillus kandeliae]MCD7035740.1 YufK family protein [Metabacillus kandeliae]
MKNTYFTGYFPLISILLYSTSLSIATVMYAIGLLKSLGIYEGMLGIVSEGEIRLAMFVLFALIFFMMLSALKLIANTVTELALLFFSKDQEGAALTKIRAGSSFYLAGGAVSILLIGNGLWIGAVFLIATFCYFVFLVYKVSAMLSPFSLIGLVLFHLLFWIVFILGILFLLVRLYNSFMSSLPI